jgi:hypothetical protein
MGSNPLYYPQVLATQWRQRDVVAQLVKKLAIDVVHQPTPISPKVPSLLTDPSCSAGHTADERRDGISSGLPVHAAEESAE